MEKNNPLYASDWAQTTELAMGKNNPFFASNWAQTNELAGKRSNSYAIVAHYGTLYGKDRRS